MRFFDIFLVGSRCLFPAEKDIVSTRTLTLHIEPAPSRKAKGDRQVKEDHGYQGNLSGQINSRDILKPRMQFPRFVRDVFPTKKEFPDILTFTFMIANIPALTILVIVTGTRTSSIAAKKLDRL
jgi:hypothetical protein